MYILSKFYKNQNPFSKMKKVLFNPFFKLAINYFVVHHLLEFPKSKSEQDPIVLTFILMH